MIYIRKPPITKYRKNIGSYQRANTNKDATRDFKTKADIRKCNNFYICNNFLQVQAKRVNNDQILFSYFCDGRDKMDGKRISRHPVFALCLVRPYVLYFLQTTDGALVVFSDNRESLFLG